MDEDVTSDLVIAEEMPVSKSPQPKIISAENKTQEINNSSNLIEKDILTETKIKTDQMQLKTYAGDSAGKPKLKNPKKLLYRGATHQSDFPLYQNGG